MRTLPFYRDDIIRGLQLGISTDEQRFVRPYVDDLIHTARARALREYIDKWKGDHYTFTQLHLCTYEPALQVNKPLECQTAVLFRVPSVIAINDEFDGFGFVGGVGSSDAFRKLRSRAEISSFADHPLLSPFTGRYISFYPREDGIIEI